MPDRIEPASSGRAKCRGCGRPIATGQLRFGEAAPNPYGEGESTFWFHLPCAACMRSEKFLALLERGTGEEPEAAELERLARFGVEHPRVQRLSRVERAASGRAHCRACRELIDKGNLRLALQIFEEGRFEPIGTIHLSCAENYFGTAEVLDRIEQLTPDLDEATRRELIDALADQHVMTETQARDELSPAPLAKALPRDEVQPPVKARPRPEVPSLPRKRARG